MARRLPKAVREAMARLEPQVQAAFLAAIGDIRRTVDVALVTRLIESGDIEGAIRAMRFDASLFGPIDRALEDSFRGGGIAAIAGLPVIKDPFDGSRVVLGFDGRHPRAEAWGRDMSSRLITGLVNEQREVARAVITQGIEAGRGPRATALDMVGRINRATGRREGGFIGLANNQAGWVQNARADLQAGRYGAYLSRDLRQPALDKMIARAQASGKPLSEAEIDRAITAYQNNVLRYRGEVIARTETLSAYRAGRSEGFHQLRDTGSVRDDQFTRTWSATGDKRTRDSHEAMDGQTVQGLETPWQLETGTVMYPGDLDGTAGPGDVIQCRCFEDITIKQDVVEVAPPAVEALPSPIVAPVTSAPVAEIAQFAYQTLARPKTLREAQDYIVQNNVAAEANFTGVKAKLLPTAAVASLEVTEKFGLSPMEWFGPLNRFGLKSRSLAKANAAIVRTTKRNRATGDVTPHNGLHVAGNFSENELDKQTFLNREYAKKYHTEASEKIAASPQFSPEVRDRFARMGDNEYAWTYSGLLDVEEHAAAIIYHEYGHVIHLIDGRIGAKINAFIDAEKPRENGWNYLLSKYANTNDKEYVAEAFSLYMHAPVSQHYRIHPALLQIFKDEDRSNVS